jgi:tetratricopeptide (TPR) repeat protein
MNSMVPTDIFFADIELVIGAFTDADRPRARRLIDELERISTDVPRVADRCFAYQARLFARLQEYEAALAAIDRALALMPLDDHLLILRGDIHRQAQDFSKALMDYTTVLQNSPEAVTARMRRAEMRQVSGDYALALQDINDALKLEPRSLRLLYRRGLILIDLRRAPEALHDFKTVAQLSPDKDLKRKAEERLRELGER